MWINSSGQGQVCFASFCISSATEDDGYLNISSDVDVYLDGKKVHDHGDCADEYVGFQYIVVYFYVSAGGYPKCLL